MSIQQLNKNQIVWQNKNLPCQVGRNGSTNSKCEGDGFTPTGKWKSDMGWSDDPKDTLYNTAIKLPCNFSHEKLWCDDHLYDLLIAISHNTNPVIPRQGSAIFIHQMNEKETPTAGCLALKLADLEYWFKIKIGEAIYRVTPKNCESCAMTFLHKEVCKKKITAEQPQVKRRRRKISSGMGAGERR